MKQSTNNKVYIKVIKHKRGIAMFPSDFSELGSVGKA